MQQLLGFGNAANLPRLGRGKLLSLGAVAAVVMGLVGVVAIRPSQPMGLLYSGLDPAEAGRIGQRLDELKVNFEARGDGGTILVPQSEVARVRMELAASGLPHQGGAGYELLDSQSPMNMTSFMQRIQRLRALEGELARTIAGMNGVKSARVHLVLPEREGFSRETPKPTASVTVTMAGPDRPTASQAAAIRLLVAGAVPRMQQDDVSVLDPAGVVLAASGGGDLAMGRLDEMRLAQEQALQRNVTNLLEPLLGRGKVRVAATVDLETARETQHEEKFDPLSQVERSKQTQNDRENSEEGKDKQPVTVGQNLPNQQVPAGGANGGGGAKNSNTSAHNSETVNYELSSTTSERVREPGDLKRLTVAVVVDGTLDDKGVYEPRSKEEVERLSELVRSAVGFNDKRGDKVTVQAMRFAPLDASGAAIEGPDRAIQPSAGLPLRWIVPGAGLAMAGMGGMAFMMLRRRKAAAQLLPPAQAELAQIGGAAGPAAVTGDAVENLFSIAAVGGAHRSPALIALNSTVDERPDEALAVLRGWITQGAPA